MNVEVRLLKLTNGEDIIAQVDVTNSQLYNIDNPLLMKVHAKMTPQGVQEGLHLSRWMQPFCESTNFSIDKKHVVITTKISVGLSRYYEHSIKSFERDENKLELPAPIKPTRKELNEIALEEAMEEDIEEFNEIPLQSKSIH